MSKEEDFKIVRVDWVDSNAIGGWFSKQQNLDFYSVPCISVGFLVDSPKNVVVLCQNHSRDQLGEFIVIPKNCVKKIKELK